MPVQFAVLASGSRGNAALVRAGGPGLLIDVGLHPRAATGRLTAIGAGWDHVAGALLTHTHGDHIGDAALRWLARRRLPLFCHEAHRTHLTSAPGLRQLEGRSLVRTYDDRPFLAPGGLQVEPIALSHDAGPTFGFRLEGKPDRRSRPVALGYVADTGCWWGAVADALTDVDLLGVEFNHDVELQRRSGRPRPLIARILGDQGHLSNAQGAALVAAVLERSHSGAVRHVVLLHLSQECNRPALALEAASAVACRRGRRTAIHAARQEDPFPQVAVRPGRRPARGTAPAEPVGFPWEAA